jgi:glycosyltransferase involved in cell wall biosynthesis
MTIDKLGGSLFIHNAIEYDYCIEKAIESIHPICKEIVCIDAQSTDNTPDLLYDLAKKFPKLKIFFDFPWEENPPEGYFRLSRLANIAREKLTTPWHFMIQADEILHESSFEHIKKAIKFGEIHNKHAGAKAFHVRRLHIYGDFEHMVSLNIPREKKPAGDTIVRLARQNLKITGDAENIHHSHANHVYTDKIVLFHYGYIRKGENLLDKGISMTAFYGDTDQRLVEMKNNKTGFKPLNIMQKHLLAPIIMPHPAIMRDWIEERKKYYPSI